jgi:hypothetical protein
MMILRSFVVLGLALSLTGSTAVAAKAKKKERAHQGVVEVVKLDKEDSAKGKEIGSLTIKGKKKKGVEGKEEKFTLAADTKVERVAGKKGNKTSETATLSALKAGDRVLVVVKDGAAKEIKIVAKKKKKNA